MRVVSLGVRGAAIAALPLLVALLTAPVVFAGGSVWPWNPRMVDLDVYRWAGEMVATGGDIYDPASGGLPFLYPPFAAVAALPLWVVPQIVAQLGWLALNTGALLAVLYRLGLSGWVLSLTAAAAIYFVEPVSGTLAFGQLGILLVALVVLDLVPGRRLLGERRLLPAGWMTGFATAIKLTPGLFAVYLTGARRWREASTVVGTFIGLTLLAAVVLPAASGGYWWRLIHGDSGTESYHYLTNQSVYGTLLRITGLGTGPTMLALALAALVATGGVVAAVAWHRRGKVGFAVTVCGVASLLASPISWSHHFVWVVPLAVLLLDRGLPTSVRIIGWLFVGWVAAAPFRRLPAGGDVELDYLPWQVVLTSTTAVLGLIFLASTLMAARRGARTTHAEEEAPSR